MSETKTPGVPSDSNPLLPTPTSAPGGSSPIPVLIPMTVAIASHRYTFHFLLGAIQQFNQPRSSKEKGVP
jgi:hypothetical protein